jgi:drug/metabolite transporter (DMT)-like permease
LSFPIVKVLGQVQTRLVPEASSWFLTAWLIAARFVVAAAVLLVWTLPTLRRITRSELWQGSGLALFGGIGLLFQVDGLAYTAATTSAFLTQFYCLLIPLWVALTQRRRPEAVVVASTLLVLLGVAILARLDWRDLRLGRGEAETLLSTVFFAAQMLWLERPCFAGNRTSHISLVMFAGSIVLFAPALVWTAPTAGAVLEAGRSWVVAACMGVLGLGCTLLAYGLMNHWQPRVTATEAGLLYCTEPLFASLFALCLPGWFSAWAGIQYPNEVVTPHLIAGGGAITLANVLIQLPALRSSRSSRPPLGNPGTG